MRGRDKRGGLRNKECREKERGTERKRDKQTQRQRELEREEERERARARVRERMVVCGRKRDCICVVGKEEMLRTLTHIHMQRCNHRVSCRQLSIEPAWHEAISCSNDVSGTVVVVPFNGEEHQYVCPVSAAMTLKKTVVSVPNVCIVFPLLRSNYGSVPKILFKALVVIRT